jgi:hypothetical protein
VQQYNNRGRPVNEASRAAARAQTRAQNEALAVVGVCVGADKPTLYADTLVGLRRMQIDRGAIKEAMVENEFGLMLSMATTAVLNLFQYSATTQLLRFQVRDTNKDKLT